MDRRKEHSSIILLEAREIAELFNFKRLSTEAGFDLEAGYFFYSRSSRLHSFRL